MVILTVKIHANPSTDWHSDFKSENMNGNKKSETDQVKDVYPSISHTIITTIKN